MRQQSARASTCRKGVSSPRHCLTWDNAVFVVVFNAGDDLRVIIFMPWLTILQIQFHYHSLLWAIIWISEHPNYHYKVHKAHLAAPVSCCLLEECHSANPFICSSSLEAGICLRDILVVGNCQLHRFAVTVNQVRFYLIKPAYLPSILIIVALLN